MKKKFLVCLTMVISCLGLIFISCGNKTGSPIKDASVETENSENTAIDLGLPSGLKWAAGNVGAKNPWDYGLYFAWGETVGYTAEQVVTGVKKFNMKSYDAKNIKYDLTIEQDAAHSYLGGKWRMPKREEWLELIEYCTAEWTDNYNGTGVKGYLFTSQINDSTIFFPAAGCCDGSTVSNEGEYGNYWTVSALSPTKAKNFIFTSWNIGPLHDYRHLGFSVRGVCE